MGMYNINSAPARSYPIDVDDCHLMGLLVFTG
jgi:hypothetical protein